MKKTFFVLPLCVFLAFCSSSKKMAAPAGPGISNVSVTRADTMTSAATASASFTSADRDWSYSSTRDTMLNGTWMLAGMMANDGSWTNTQTSTMTSSTDTAMSMMMDTTSMASSGKKMKGKMKANRKALYDSANARINLSYKDTAALDTTAEAFQYWKRVPSITINASRLVFSGNTGCNSVSGSFNFNKQDIQFGRNIVTSKMACNEYDETVFLSALKKADSYTLNGNMLEIKQGNTLLLTFKRS